MPRVDVSHTARDDIAQTLDWTLEHFGPAAAQRYEALIHQGLADLARDPLRAGSTSRFELGGGIRSFHLMHSRNRVGGPAERVQHPRHLLVFRVASDDTVEILRVLHERADVRRHLADDSEC